MSLRIALFGGRYYSIYFKFIKIKFVYKNLINVSHGNVKGLVFSRI